ncbi:hypothetical protein [Hyunsoonleella rubra]|uniref:Uncharacterized protein n=1 Tax=Hyunsoonleella rubra TaxID=1737062 RepID=A0ABW5TCC0_9FLAO
MKYFIYLFTISFMLSCGNERELQLPQIEKADITKIQDVSVAYLFYDETQPDSVLLNRKNLISTTNWLINVDKRLTLKQAIPHIKYLQEKKQNSSHKNEKAKNYFTCHDLSKNNLGFLEFTNIAFHKESFGNYFAKVSRLESIMTLNVMVKSSNKIIMLGPWDDSNFKTTDILNLHGDLNDLVKSKKLNIKVILDIDDNISFQDYITIKSQLSKLNIENLSFSKDEFIY